MDTVVVGLFGLLVILVVGYVYVRFVYRVESNACESVDPAPATRPVPAYVINRRSRPERLTRFQKAIEPFASRLNVTVIEASDEDTEPDLRSYSSKFRPGEIGCYLSHIRTLRTFLETEEPWCIVFEDDADCTSRLNHIMNAYDPTRYDLLVLGVRYVQYTGTKRTDSRLQEEVYRNPKKVYGSHFYFINRKAARVLVERAFPMKRAYDAYFCNHTDLKVGATRTVCLVDDVTDSDTHGSDYATRFRRGLFEQLYQTFPGLKRLTRNEPTIEVLSGL